MKSLKYSSVILLFCISGLSCTQSVTAQKPLNAKQLAIKNLVDSQRYVFYAEYVIPLNSTQRFLTSDYILSISKDTIISDLPYFGQSYTAPINTTEVGIKFTSTNFDYLSTVGKKNSWNIGIRPKDVPDVRQFNMTIYDNGTASLQVSSINRQPISFSGKIQAKR